MASKTNILDNRGRGTVGDFLKEKITTDAELSVVSAYFTIYAYHNLSKELDSIKSMRFLFGEPNFLSLDPNKKQSKVFTLLDNTITLANNIPQSSIAKACAKWIKEKVEIKSMEKPDFLHGKMYHIKETGGKEHAIVGSANFTSKGLGLVPKSNLELSLKVDSNRDTLELMEWFDELWAGNIPEAKVRDVKEDVLQYLAKVYADKSPEFIYLKTLYHLFEDRINAQGNTKEVFTQIHFDKTQIWKELFDFQQEGVKNVINKILRHNGCILADSVGLGKTFEALAVIKYFELQNHRVLVLCPKKLRENWAVYTQNKTQNILEKDRFAYDVLSHTDLTRTSGKSGNIDLANVNWGNYGLVVIDESHNFRNNGKSKKDAKGNIIRQSRYDKLMQDILTQGIPTKVLLLSATPVNNSLKDLKNQINFITQGNDEALWQSKNIKSINDTLDQTQKVFAKWANARTEKKNINDLLEKINNDFFTLLDEITIARSRKHILKYYTQTKPLKPEENNKPFSFPQRLKNIAEYPEIDVLNEFPSFDKINDDISKYEFSLYNPAKFVKDDKEIKAKYGIVQGTNTEFNQETREHHLTGMIKMGFLKRLESSIFSFFKTLENTIKKINETIEKIENFINNNANDIQNDNTNDIMEVEIQAEFATEEETEDEEDMEDTDEKNLVGKKLKYNLKDLQLEKWIKALKRDKDELRSVANNAKIISHERDAKLQRLKEIITKKINNPLNPNNKKILVFTAYADTAEYLYTYLNAWATQTHNLHTALITGGTKANKSTFTPKGFDKQTTFQAILTNFSPIAKDRNKDAKMPQEGEIDILIATDCISEGQNLQDCDFLINYDIHWNPVRLIQRFGRIDRLGSVNTHIQMLNFWATKDLEKYLNLKLRVEAKMAVVDLTATADDNILKEEQQHIENDIKYRYAQLEKLKHETLDLEDMQEGASLDQFTMEEFFSFLMRYLTQHKDDLAEAEMGMHALVPAILKGEQREEGIIFCFKQKIPQKPTKQSNPFMPYFLVYIQKNGTIKYTHTQAKGILDAYSNLCQGINMPYYEICENFDKETQQGKDMTTYQNLIKKALESIAPATEEQEANNLFSGRNFVISDKSMDKNEDTAQDNYQLITWLVVHGEK